MGGAKQKYRINPTKRKKRAQRHGGEDRYLLASLHVSELLTDARRGQGHSNWPQEGHQHCDAIAANPVPKTHLFNILEPTPSVRVSLCGKGGV